MRKTKITDKSSEISDVVDRQSFLKHVAFTPYETVWGALAHVIDQPVWFELQTPIYEEIFEILN